jgi:hypothetical protein
VFWHPESKKNNLPKFKRNIQFGKRENMSQPWKLTKISEGFFHFLILSPGCVGWKISPAEEQTER